MIIILSWNGGENDEYGHGCECECGRGNAFYTTGLLGVSNVYDTQSNVDRCPCPSNRNIWWRNIALLFSTENLNISFNLCTHPTISMKLAKCICLCHYVRIFHWRFLVIHNYVNDSGSVDKQPFCVCVAVGVPCFHLEWAKRSKRNKLNNAWIIYWIIFIPIQALHYIQSRASKFVCFYVYFFFASMFGPNGFYL